MQLFYLDESGNTGTNLDDPQQPIHWLLAIGMTPAALQRAESDLLAIAVRYAHARAHAPEFEFHGADIYQGTGSFSFLTPADRVRLYDEILAVIPRHRMNLFCRGINKREHRDLARANFHAPEHPQVLAFTFLVEALDDWLHERQPKPPLDGALQEPTLGLVVADENRDLDRTIVERFSRWRRSHTDHGSRGAGIRHLIDTVHHVPSCDSWMIQLADCTAYLLSRLARVREAKGWGEAGWKQSDQAVSRLWTAHCQDRVVHFRVGP